MAIVVEVVVLWLMIGGDSRHKVVGGAQASLILGSNPVFGTWHHFARLPGPPAPGDTQDSMFRHFPLKPQNF